MDILLSRTKGVVLFEVKVSQSVIDLSMVSLICSDGKDDISHHGSLSQLPVGDSNAGGRQVVPHGQLAFIQLGEDVSVGHNCLLLKISNKPNVERNTYLT